jgi:hypothetical protein
MKSLFKNRFFMQQEPGSAQLPKCENFLSFTLEVNTHYFQIKYFHSSSTKYAS